MTYEEALHEVSTMVFRNTDDCEMRISKDCYKKIRDALEKQIPKKHPRHYCNARARYGHPDESYCCHCGQAIDWSADE